MQKKYILALLSKKPDIFVREAQKHFSDLTEGYLLGENSRPHITLCQFFLNSPNLLPEIWEEVQQICPSPPQPSFTKFAFKKNIFKDNLTWWAQLVVGPNADLIHLHTLCVFLLEKKGISCINAHGKNYDPHLTLALNKELRLSDLDTHLFDPSPFELALGEADELGQFVQTVRN
jgi:2'-5' RNA ligase